MLTIEVISYKQRASVRPLARQFDETGGTIGRDESCSLWLEDPEQGSEGSAISREHARIEYQKGHYVIIDNGTNPLRLNNRAVGKGKEAPLTDEDQVRIGDYVLKVRLGQTGIPLPNDSTPRVARAMGEGSRSESVIETIIDRGLLDRVPDVAGGSQPAELDRSSVGSGTGEGLSHPRSRDLEILEAKMGMGGVRPEPNPLPEKVAAPAEQQPTAKPIKTGQSAAHSAPAAPSGAVVSWQQDEDPVQQTANNVPTPPKEKRGLAAVPRARTSVKGTGGAKVQPSAHEASATKPKPRAPVPTEDSPLPAGLAEAFLAGAGNPPLVLPDGFNAITMYQLGELMRATVEGMLQLLKVRTETKVEVGAKVTIVAPYVNPLKFSPDADYALQQLLAPQSQGFMPGTEAIHDAFSDFISHQVGLLAGLDAAMNALIDRFSPDKLERQLVEKRLLDTVIPFKQKAKLWDLFETKFDDIKDKAREGIDNVFKTEFVKAYENKVAELRRARLPDSARES